MCQYLSSSVYFLCSSAVHVDQPNAGRSILCGLYTEYIHHLSIKLQIVKSALQKYCEKTVVFLFLYISGKEREKALPCVSCIQLKLAFRKKIKKCRGCACDRRRSVWKEHALSKASSPEKVKVGSRKGKKASPSFLSQHAAAWVQISKPAI